METANKTATSADIRCPSLDSNGDHYWMCDRLDCIDGTLACDCGERAAVERSDVGTGKGLLQCKPCLDDAAALEDKWRVDERADAAETQRRLGLYRELERAALEAGVVARVERAQRGAA